MPKKAAIPQDDTLWLQDFYDEVEPIKLLDPLSWTLGAQKEGDPFVFTFKDAVKMAGHSCPAVSSAYKVTALALKALYEGDTPVRGDIKILIKGGPSELAYGPQSQVMMLITGASGETGFKGLGGKFSRNGKLLFDAADPKFCTYIFKRLDTGKTVQVEFDPGALPPDDPAMAELTPKAIKGVASKAEKEKFIALWQGKVKKILLEADKYPGLFKVTELRGFKFPE